MKRVNKFSKVDIRNVAEEQEDRPSVKVRDRVKNAIQGKDGDEKGQSLDKYAESEQSSAETEYTFSYREAKESPSGVLIMEGDYGGQIYLTCPMKYVQCGPEAIKQLILELDSMAWACNEGDGAEISYMTHWDGSDGESVGGGMGGGFVVDGLWVHGEFSKLKDSIWQVLQGKVKSLKEALNR